MTTEIKDQLTTLALLQENETAIARLESVLAGVDSEIAALEARILEAQVDVDQSRELLDSLKKQYRADESEVKTLESRAGKSDEKLRSVKTNKEYQSILKEIDDLKVKAGEIEDRMLSMLEQIENAEAAVKEKKKDLDASRADVESRQAEIRSAAEEQRRTLAEKQRNRESIWSDLTPQLQKLYLKAKRQGRGIGVAAVESAVCQVCRMNIPPQLYNELLRLDSLRFCPNCQRIIYPQTMLG